MEDVALTKKSRAEVHKFLKVEDVNLTAKSGDKLAVQSAKVDKFLQLEEVNLAVQLGGVLKQIFAFQSAEFKEC